MTCRYSHALPLFTAVLTAPVLAQTVTIPENSLAIGLGLNSLDSYRFGRFTGITDDGPFAAVQLDWRSTPTASDAGYWSVTGRNLGLDTGGFTLDYGRSGRFRFFLRGDQLPHYRFEDGKTPFRGSGSALQTLPANWVGANSSAGLSTLDASLLPMQVDKQRQRLTTGLTMQFSDAWQFAGEYRHETKQGEETLGAIFGSTGGNPRGALLARPIDFETDTIELGLNRTGARSQYSFSYNAMLFSNHDASLSWQNPFNNPQWPSGASYRDGAFGQMALEPDTRSSQLQFSGAHTFDDGGRLSGSLSTTRLEQDDRFLPYSSALAAPVPLPRTDLAGRVDTLVASLNYSRTLSRRLLLRLRGNYTDRDNKTPQALYLRVAGDAANQADPLSINARRNRLYDLQTSRIEADLSLRLGGARRLAFGLEHESKDRSSVDVARTREDTGYLKYNFTAGSRANGWLKLSHAERDATAYDSTIPLRAGHNPDFIATLIGDELFENDPFLRRYHLTDRDRDELSSSVNFFPTDALAFSVLAKRSADDYPDSTVGLLDSRRRNLAFDLSLNPGTGWQASIYYALDDYLNRQAGYARSGGGNPTPFYPASVRLPGNAWRVKSTDQVSTTGLGIDWDLLDSRLQLGLDLSYADAVTTTESASSGLNRAPLPAVSTLIKNVSLTANYDLGSDRELQLNYYYEDLNSSDWALDGVTTNTLSNVLLPGNSSPAYYGHLLLVSYVLRLH